LTVDDALSALTPGQRAALELLLRRERATAAQQGTGPDLAPIPRRADRAAFPLSFAQQRLWFLDQLSPGDPAYNIHGALRLRGALDIAALARSLRAIAARHEALRSRFQAVDGRPEQSVAPPGDPALPVVDLSALAAGRRTAEVLRLAVAEARRPFDLARGPLLRAALLCEGPAESVLLVTMHHIVSDGWSIGILERELAAFYAGSETPPPPLPLQYADFAAWQRWHLAGDRLAGEVAHWRARLDGLPELHLPEDGAHMGHNDRRGGLVPLAVPARLAGRLKEVGRGAGASLFMTLLAAFEVLLLRWSGQRDFAVGTPIANRNRPEIEGLIGFFVNTLVMRADLTGDPTFLGLLERVRQTALDAFTHQDLPFEKLVEELQPERRLGRNPLFSTLFVLQNAGQAQSSPHAVSLPGLDLTFLPVRNGTFRFDLTLELAEGDAGLTGFLEHGPAPLSALAAGRMAGHLLAVLEAVAAEPRRPLAELPVLTAAERHQILVEWAGPEMPVPAESLAELFTQQAARSPGAVAVVCEGEILTYRDLDVRSSQLAWHLRRLGAGPESAVAISLERSAEMVVGVLGILKAGAAYLPIDPLNPRERQTFMLEDCGATVLLTLERWAESFRRPGLCVLCLDSDLETFAGEPAEAPPAVGFSNNTIALLYTSGSTGKPKATLVERRGFLNLCHWYRDACPITASTISLQGFAFSFDAAFKGLVAPLLAGGCLVLANPGPFDPVEVWTAIRDQKVTQITTTPSQLYPVLSLAAADGYASLSSLEVLILSGEAAHWSELWPWLASGRCRAILGNMYGPSECSDTVTSYSAAPGAVATAERLPLGRAGYNIRLVVVDGDLQPLPVGVPGELCASGVCVARGYYGRPELTAERFIPAPFWGERREPGERMYRTGDLVRWLPDGNLEFLGRLDHQVKIRGVRVELAEVEAALALHPAVRSTVVLARPGRRASDIAGVNVRLVAWIVPAEGAGSPAEGELRHFLRDRLPEVMVPSAFVPLAELPVNSRGKLDRAALPEPEPGRMVAEAGSSLGDPAEELMAALFAELLGRERVGVHDSFFELGGHSLLATRLVSRVRSAFGVELPVRRLFESPTPAKLAAAVQGLGSALPAPPPLCRRAGGGPVPLSLAQQRLWVLHQLSPGLIAYHVPAALRLRGPLDTPALERALTAVVARHEALRTRFPVSAEGPVQEVEPPAPVMSPVILPQIDLTALPEAVREAAALRLAGEEARRPFDLARGPLLRLRLLRCGADEHVLFLTVHHLVSDGWSAAIFLRELSVFYAAFATGAPAGLPALPVQYADYAVWQREWLRGETLAAQLGFWKARLAGAPRVLDLPLDFPRPPAESQTGGAVALRLPGPLIERLRHLGREAGATLYMTLLTAFQALLARAAGEEAVSVGTPVAGRHHAELEGLIGFFVNTLVIHTRLAGAPSVRGLIGRVREALLGAFSHQDLPFEKLVEALNPERDPRWSPLFQVVFALQNVPREELRLPGIEASRLEVDTGTVQFDLAATLTESSDGAAGSLRYRAALFTATTVRRLAGHFEALLEGMAAHPDRRLAELPLLSEAEREQVLGEWSGAGSGAPGPEEAGEDDLPALFAAQAARTPDRPAVVLDGVTLSYGELDRRAELVAGALRRLHVGLDSRVAICLERSPDLLVAILGVMRAGGAYVPLDPASPRERLAGLLADAAPAAVLAAPSLAGRLPAAGAPVLTVAEALAAAPRQDGPPFPAPFPVPSFHNLAYLIYTSGSTGAPKGTLICRGALAIFARGLREAVAELRGAPLRLGLNASIAFDASVQLIVQLAAGHTLRIVPEQARRDGESMAVFLRAAGLDGIDCTPSQLELLLAAMETSGQPPRFVLIGGEAIPPALWQRMAAHPTTRFYNVYGPTECTVEATARLLDPMDRGGRPDLGRPIAGYRLYVLDAAGLPVPAGFRGEIRIGDPTLARGYWRRPDLTADRFRPDPFGGVPGARLYRSGDLGRWLPDGRIESFGRTDLQIKLRGFRIEPGEIEAQLAAHPEVAAAVVDVRDDLGDRRLVAWIVPEGAARPSGDELRQFLRSRLPDVMVPTVFVLLPALPLSSRGKLDRKALPEPGWTDTGAGASPVSPGHPAEELMADLFADLLGRAQVGAHENFFDLGGHSLLATRLVSRVRAAFGVELPVRRVFESPTPAELAAAVRDPDSALPTPPPLQRRGDSGPAPLSPAQQRLWLLDRIEPGNPAYNIPLSVRLQGDLPVGLFESVLGEIVRRHEPLRTIFTEAFTDAGGAPVQVIAPAEEWRSRLSLVDLAGLSDGERQAQASALALAEARRPFDLRRGPLLRLALLRLGEREHVLLLTMHHIVSDGWSLGVLLREVSALYDAFAQGRPSPLPELPIQYADFAVWQRDWLAGENLAAQLAFWKRQLLGAPRQLALPADRPRPALQTYDGAVRPLALPPGAAAALRRLCRRAAVTPFMALLAAWGALLGLLAGQEDVLVGTPVAGRNRREVEALIGFFVNTLALRIHLSGAPGFGVLLERVREMSLDAFAHQEIPFERLIEEIVTERNPAIPPLFQVFFDFQNVPRGELELPGLALSPVEAAGGSAKFDLTLTLHQEEGTITGALGYNTDLFDATTADLLAARFTALLEAALEDPERAVGELPLLLPAERQQVLVEGNDTHQDTPRGLCLHELITAQAARTPDAVAVTGEDRRLTYRDLELESNRLARRLLAEGLAPEARVGILLERSPEMLIALLGVLKAGAAYVPLDPSHPAERMSSLLASAGVTLVLTQERLDAERDAIDRLSASQVTVQVQPDQLAYVLYTSGSTGAPKGVMVQHGSLVNYLTWCTGAYGLGPGRRSLLLSSLGFDFTVTALFAPLLAGGEVAIVRESAGSESIENIARALRETEIDLLKLTPAHLELLAHELEPAAARRVKTLVVGGEALSGQALALWRAASPATLVVNEYGPTEATVGCSVHAAPAGEIADGRVPIGRPIANARLYVVDSAFGLRPPGAPGELVLGGEILARGYLGRPDLTAERFVPDPFGEEPGGRLYRTGDLALRRHTGSFEFLGRDDDQVKVRGYRIELGEIEAALERDPRVRSAVVAVRDTALVGYVVAEGEPFPTAGELRGSLREWLPPYMIPANFVFLDRLPLTPHGKVDRRALSVEPPAPERGTPGSLEAKLAELWAAALGLDRVRSGDDFFALGGHSLSALGLASRIRETFGVRLPVRHLFAAPTPAAMAELLRGMLGETLGQPVADAAGLVVALQPRGARAPFFCVHPGGGDVTVYRELALSLDSGRPFLALRAPGLEEGEEPLRDIGALAERHLRDMRRAQPEGPWHLGGWSSGAVVAFEIARRLRAAGGEVAALVLLDPPDLPFTAADPDDVEILASPQAAGLPLEGKADLERRLRVFRGTLEALRAYEPGSWDGPLTLLEAAARPAPATCWRTLATAVITVPGDHATILRPPQVEELARRVREALG
jgi:amino acid adenylation domain-containing protein